MSLYPGYLCQFKVSLPTFFSKKVGRLLTDKSEFVYSDNYSLDTRAWAV